MASAAVAQVTVTTTAGVIRAHPTASPSAPLNRVVASLVNLSTTVDVWLGTDNTVTPSTGYPLKAGGSHDVQSNGDIYGVTASGSATVAIWEEVE